MLRDVRSHQRGVRLIEVEIDVSELDAVTPKKDGVIRGFEHVVAIDDGGGVTTINLVHPGVRPCMVFCQNLAALACTPTARTKDSVTIDSGAVDFQALIVVFDSPDET